MNSNKNKLNGEIIFIFHFNPNGHLLLLLQYIYIPTQPNLIPQNRKFCKLIRQ